ncbi:hypothetical protein [Streptomyces yangpuensis]|uniref:hypothetical protein n=1 Tax=Streptomyces yangpuensis TaxID=1648182 RepID=UPI003717138F
MPAYPINFGTLLHNLRGTAENYVEAGAVSLALTVGTEHDDHREQLTHVLGGAGCRRTGCAEQAAPHRCPARPEAQDPDSPRRHWTAPSN